MSIMMLPTRDGYGYGLLELGAANPDVLVLDADLQNRPVPTGLQPNIPNDSSISAFLNRI